LVFVPRRVLSGVGFSTAGDDTVKALRSSRERKSINFRVHALASSLFKGAQQYYGTRFGVGIPEMRILSNLDSEGPLTASHLVTLTAMDKGLLSRILVALLDRKLLQAVAPASDPRRRTWSLSRSGKRLVETLRPIWKRREAIIQAGLTRVEQDQLEQMLERLFLASEALREAEAQELRKTRLHKTRPRAPRARAKSPFTAGELVD
jgi:DNA-binding MarR family transcriptional regulator